MIILSGHRDVADVAVQDDQLKELLQRYADLPRIIVSMSRPTIREVAECLD